MKIGGLSTAFLTYQWRVAEDFDDLGGSNVR